MFVRMKDYNTNENKEKIIAYFKQRFPIAEAIKMTHEFFDNPTAFDTEEFMAILALLKPKEKTGRKVNKES